MANAEQIFNSCSLDLIVPDSVLQLPAHENSRLADDWLKLARDSGERKQAFFDEKLDFYLAVCFKQQDQSPSLLSPDLLSPPVPLLTFLSHLQVSLEASYIQPAPQEVHPNGRFPALPIRSSSATSLTPKVKGLGSLPIFPPQTPSPKPATSETDKRYVFSEGTPLNSFVWGEDPAEEADAFRLLRSNVEKCWVAIYKLSVSVVYAKTQFRDPLLCLTTSITLRDRPLPQTPQRQSLNDLIIAAGPLPPLIDTSSLRAAIIPGESSNNVGNRPERGFLEEVNLLEGLSTDLTGSDSSDKLYLPTTRLGTLARRAYSLPPITPTSPAVPTHSPSHSLPVLRKSFRKTLGVASGFHVRMRTVIVPQIYFPESADDEQEVSSEESTTVLSIEIEHPGDSEAGFSVEAINVSIKKEDAKIRLIGWGGQGFADPAKVFPLLIRSREQYYLLYAVTFLRSPDMELFQDAEQDRLDEYKKMVSIHIIGRPFFVPGTDPASAETTDQLSYPTLSFLSRWNCVLDLDPRRRDSEPPLESSSEAGPNNAMPFPPSPFPAASSRPQQVRGQASALASAQVNTMAGVKRHTFAGTISPFLSSPQRPISLNTSPSGTPGMGRLSPLGKQGGKLWMVASPSSTPGPLSPPLPPLPTGSLDQGPPSTATAAGYPLRAVPPTPAYPSYGSQPGMPCPNSVTPSFGQMGHVGLGIEARRERFALPGMPLTPGPQLAVGEGALAASYRNTGELGPNTKDFVVSVSLIPPGMEVNDALPNSNSRGRRQPIYPLDEFSLEIFVFNQSPYVRKLEATLAGRRDDSPFPPASVGSWKPVSPDFTPLENRVRIGPLGPSTCQSVTMRFLAIAPGIHTIDGLVLTDLDSGESISLRSVMDFAVRSRNREF